jgi:hypothetical protein
MSEPSSCPALHRSLPRSGWELVTETFIGAQAFVDCQGRPLGEVNAPAPLLEGVPLQLQTCKYAGSRHLHPLPMNISALRQMTENWAEVLAGVRFLRASYLRCFGLTELNHGHAWRLSRMGTALPAYLLCRPQARIADGSIPLSVALVYKVLAGVFQALQHRYLFAVAMGQPLQGEPIPADVLAHAEQNEMLLGKTGVCAGPNARILELLEQLLSNAAPEPATDCNELERVLGDPLPFFRYGTADVALQLGKFVFGVQWRACLYQLEQRVHAESPTHEALPVLKAELRRAFESAQLALPDALFSEEAAPIRSKVVAALQTELAVMESWLVAQQQLEAASVSEGTKPALAPAAGAAPEALLQAALTEYDALEQAALEQVGALQRAIDRMLKRPDALRMDACTVERAFCGTPRRVLERLLADHAPRAAHWG